MMSLTNMLISGCLLASSSLAVAYSSYDHYDYIEERDPVGETAFYRIDTSGSRTSSMIRSGHMTTSVTKAIPDASQGPAYEVKLDYTMKVFLGGTQKGSRTMAVPQDYFTPEFMEDLRANGTFESPQFKAKHLGYGNAKNMDGFFYPNCDKVLIYDVKDAGAMMLTAIASDILKTSVGTFNEIEDMEILTHVQVGYPVIGAVKLDMSGKYSGTRVKAGADYIVNP